ncbi:DUF6401 family natural product biosynthesis protein [Actinocorallia sp. A-T 12471]|uniref:DUF6401 family natural product biosynthesis protein n=1 Tax=Actinocorallia sp. A-T 12471 TaxID=3089813 RepID=UPI0029CE99BE|nr:DUF6401 family natural product biosynthesis protein [Actinocorallia sp. A-T 12471]MDX6742831.1 DUF6401 family natural product biosynthesis protein [Actinocorallia sp. A-T 12471]
MPSETSHLTPLSRVGWAPGLHASADQHSAAVRDILTASGLEPNPSTLLEYLDGFVSGCAETGWTLGPRLDWHAQRILTVQRMIELQQLEEQRSLEAERMTEAVPPA